MSWYDDFWDGIKSSSTALVVKEAISEGKRTIHLKASINLELGIITRERAVSVLVYHVANSNVQPGLQSLQLIKVFYT